MKRFLLILGVLLWLHSHDAPIAFPDADSVRVGLTYQVSFVTNKIIPVMVVSILDHGEEVYSIDIKHVKGMTVGDWII